MPRPPETLAPELEILYRDDVVVVVNKPSGLLTHRGWAQDSVVAMTVTRDLIGQHVHPVHRLDRPTSGVLVFALTPVAAKSLMQAFAERKVEKRYIAFVRGVPPDDGIIDYAIPKRPKGERVPAVTHYSRLASVGRYSLVEARPKTGRLHQIRRHLRHIGHPLIGDVNHGVGKENRKFRAEVDLHRLALHALEVSFPHPETGAMTQVVASLPDDLALPLGRVGFDLAALCLPFNQEPS